MSTTAASPPIERGSTLYRILAIAAGIPSDHIALATFTLRIGFVGPRRGRFRGGAISGRAASQLETMADPAQAPNALDGQARPSGAWSPDWWAWALLGCVAVAWSVIQIRVADIVPRIFLTYVALGLAWLLFTLAIYVRRQRREVSARLVDKSEVEALLVDARTIQPRESHDDYDEKRKQLDQEVERLTANPGPDWTEYEILPLRQMLVDFLKEDDLCAQARSYLDDVYEYAYDAAYEYEFAQYRKWEKRITGTINRIKAARKDETREPHRKVLRAEMLSLIEHLTNYDRDWAQGSVIRGGIVASGVAFVVIATMMGTLPLIGALKHDLTILNAMLLGTTGAALPELYAFWKSDFVEVGSVRGRKHLQRAMVAIALGTVAGGAVFAAINGGVFTGQSGINEGASGTFAAVFWSLAAGYSFEQILRRLDIASTKPGHVVVSDTNDEDDNGG